MSERLITMHVIEDNGRGGESIYEVKLLVEDSWRAAMAVGRRWAFRSTLRKAQALIEQERRGQNSD